MAKITNLKRRTEKNLIDWIAYKGLVSFTFLLPLIYLPFLEDSFSLPKAILLKLFLFFSLALFILIINHKKIFFLAALKLPLFILIIWLIASLPLSSNPSLSFTGNYLRDEGILAFLGYLSLYFFAFNFIDSEKKALEILKLLLIISVVESLIGILQSFGIDPIHLSGKSFEVSRSSGTFGNPVFLGSFLVLTLPISITFSLNSKLKREKILYSIITITLGICLLFTFSRGAWVGFIISLIIFLFLSPEILKEKKKGLLALLLIFIFFLTIASLTLPRKTLFSRISWKADEGILSRIDLWKGTIKLIYQKPLWGYGLETFRGLIPKHFTPLLAQLATLQDRPHNQFLYLAFSLGIVGLLIFNWIIIAFFRIELPSLSQMKKERKMILTGILASAGGYLVQEQFSFSLVGVTPIFWLFLGIAHPFVAKEKPLVPLPFILKNNLGEKLVFTTLGIIILACFFSQISFFLADYYFKKGLIFSQYAQNQLLWEEAIINLKKAVTLNPFQNKYREVLGESYRKGGQGLGIKEWGYLALKTYYEGIKRDPLDENFWLGLGDVYLYNFKDKESKQKAIQAYKEALKIDPLSPIAKWAIGDVYLEEKKYDLAIKNLEEAVAISPRKPGIYFSLGLAYERMGKWDEAYQAYQRVYQQNPNYSGIKETLKRVKKRALNKR